MVDIVAIQYVRFFFVLMLSSHVELVLVALPFMMAYDLDSVFRCRLLI